MGIINNRVGPSVIGIIDPGDRQLKWGGQIFRDTNLNLEMKNLCKIMHPNLVRIFRAVEEVGAIGIAMELLYCTFHQAVIGEKKDFPKKKRFAAVRQISEGLKFLHSSDIVHSNLTSKNIFLNTYTAKIGNYGPKLVRSKLESIYDPVWEDLDEKHAAPELLPSSSPILIDGVKKADVYSLALVAYEVLSSKEPCTQRSKRTNECLVFLQPRNMPLNMFEIIKWVLR